MSGHAHVDSPVPSPPLIEDAPIIFIGGAGRSGTSLLRTILNAHSHISIGAELKVTPEIAQFWRRMLRYSSHLAHYFDLEERDLNEAFGTLICSLLSKKLAGHGDTVRLGEKTPNNVFVFPHLHRIFPESPLLHIIRDGRDVVRSLLRQNWASPDGSPLAITQDSKAAAAYWVKAVTAGRRASRMSSTLADRYLEIRYEELVTNTESVARSIFEHLGEPWEPRILDFHKHEVSVYDHVYRPVTDRSVGKWRQDLSPDQKMRVKEVAGDLLIQLGYAKDLSW